MISSHQNPVVKRIKRLSQRKYRRAEGTFFVEGPRAFLAAIEQNAGIAAAVYSVELLRSELCWRGLKELENAGIPIHNLSAAVFKKIAQRDNPAGIGAIVRHKFTAIEKLIILPEAVFVALVEPADPGNVGTILRSMDAFGGAGLILVGQTVDPTHPKTIKASMGAFFSVPICLVETVNEVWVWAENAGIQTIATSAKATTTLTEVTWQYPCLILMGSERHGLPADLLPKADQQIVIPMQGEVTSLNLAVTASLLLFAAKNKI